MDAQTIHDTIIMLHAASSTLAFFAGCLLIFSPNFLSNGRLFAIYKWALIGMVFLLAGAILVYWTQYSSIERIVFPGLLMLAIYMLYRAWSASHLLGTQSSDWKKDYIEHIGFTLIALFEGFIIVSGLNSGFPGWLVALVAVMGVLIGRWLISFDQQRVA